MFKKLIQKYKANPRAKQVLGLFSVNIVGIPIGIVTSIVVTRFLGAQAYGDYRLIHSIFSFAVVIFTFGFFQAGNRALVLNDDKQKAKEYFGAELVITGGLFVMMSFFLLLYALFDGNIQEKQLSNVLLFVIPFGWVFLLLRYFESLLQADNRIRMLAKVRLYPTLGFLIMAGALHFVFRHISANRLAVVMSFYIATQSVVYVFILLKLKVSFKNLKNRLQEIWSHNKSFGFNVYLGSLFALGFAQLTQILISYFGVDNSGVGFYSLAVAFSMPLMVIPNTIATTHYREFSKSGSIPWKVFFLTLALSLVALMGLWLIVPTFVNIFYGKEFSSVISLNFIVSFGAIAHGFGDFFNRFLGANGQGKALRNAAIFVGVIVMLFNLLFIPQWGALGAAYAKLISGFAYLMIIVAHYIKYIRNNIHN